MIRQGLMNSIYVSQTVLQSGQDLVCFLTSPEKVSPTTRGTQTPKTLLFVLDRRSYLDDNFIRNCQYTLNCQLPNYNGVRQSVNIDRIDAIPCRERRCAVNQDG